MESFAVYQLLEWGRDKASFRLEPDPQAAAPHNTFTKAWIPRFFMKDWLHGEYVSIMSQQGGSGGGGGRTGAMILPTENFRPFTGAGRSKKS